MAATVSIIRERIELRPLLRRAVAAGLVGGSVGVYLAAVGILERFGGRDLIAEVVTLGYSMLLLTWAATGFLAARPKQAPGYETIVSSGNRLVAGLLGGAVSGVVLALFTLLFNTFELDFFVNVTPSLLEDTLQLGQGTGAGTLILIGLGAGIGVVGAALHLLRPPDRKAILIGVATLMVAGTLEQLIAQMIDTLNFETSWLYEGSALTVPGAVILFVVAAGLSLFMAHRDAVIRRFTGRRRSSAEVKAAAQEQQIVTAVQIAEERAPADRGDKIALGLGLAALVLGLLSAAMGFSESESSSTVFLATIIVGGIATGYAASRSRDALAEGRSRTMPTMAFVASVAGLFIVLPWLVGQFLSDVLGTVGIYVLLGLGLNIVVGYAGLLDLGYVAFFAVGAYMIALLTSPISGLVAEGVGEFGSGSQVAGDPLMSFWLALPISLIVAVVFGILLGGPVVRLRGDYLAIVTLGFGEIIRVVVQSDAAAGLLGGSQGIKRIPEPVLFGTGLRDPEPMYYLIFAGCLLMAYVSWRVQYSRTGRAWAAMREDEDVAEAMGISIIKYKLLAFAIGAGVASLGGIFFAAKIGVTTPESFQLQVSISVLAVVVLGGMGSIPGVIVGSVALIGLPELLREFAAEYRPLFYGAALVAIMVLKPEGLLPNVRRRRELQEREAEEAQYEARSGEPTPEPVIKPGVSEEETTPPEEKR